MLQKKKNKILVLYLLAFVLTGPLIFWLSNSGQQLSSQITEPRQPASGGLFNYNNSNSLQKRISLGDKVLITADTSPDKQAGTQAFASGNFPAAITKFNSALQINRNDPETWIYSENAVAATKGDVVKIGVSVPIGGNLNIAKEILRGVAQAQYEVNHNGGIGGKLVQVEIVNDDNNPAIAQQLASEFVKDSSMLAVVGHNSSEASIAAAPVYQAGGLVMISPTSVASELSGIGSYIFRTTPSTRVTADTLARYTIQSARKTKVAVCAASKIEASKSFKEEFTWAILQNGGKITNTACDFSSPNFNPSDIPSQAIGDGADALLLAISVEDIDQAIEVIQENKRRLPLLGSQTMYTFETLQQGQVDANGMVLAVAWHPTAFPSSSFPINAQKFWGGTGNWRTATAYDATQVIATGLKLGPTRDQLQKTLSSSGFSVRGATGLIQFLQSGDRNMQGILVKIQPGQNSGTGFDFMPLSALIQK